MERPQGLLQGARGEASAAGLSGALWGRPEGMRRVAAPSTVVTAVVGGSTSCGKARAGVAGCACGLQAATRARRVAGRQALLVLTDG